MVYGVRSRKLEFETDIVNEVVERKGARIKQRYEEQTALGGKIDKEMGNSSLPKTKPSGCLSTLVSLLFGVRKRDGDTARALAAVSQQQSATATPAAAQTAGSAPRAIFGLAGKRVNATEKLEEAAEAMRTRVEQLEARVSEQRAEATRLMKANQKQAALRALKKANAVQKQVDSNQAAVDAVEQQMDALSQAAMQKTLASALASTSKTMKKDAKAVSKAEAAIDDAQEARDMATDLSQIMADFAQTGQGFEDEDDLMMELQAMAEASEDTNRQPAPVAIASQEQAAQAARELAQKHSEWDAAEALRQTLPRAPRKGKEVERAGLLATH